jgi:uncharacterized YigZ family protein
MLFDDTFCTLSEPTEGQFRDRGSRFLAYAYPIRSETDAKQRLETLRQQHPKAAHHCYAYRLGLGKDHYRVNDDGEPGGTAGRPILNTIYSHDKPGQPLTNILVVVVRYFGGTLLGVPGLINAYKSATVEALANARFETRTIDEQYRIRFSFEQMNSVMRLVKEQQLTVVSQSFDNEPTLEVSMRKTQVNSVLDRLSQLPGVQTEWMPNG